MRKKISSRNYFLVRRFAKFITHYALQSHEGMTGDGGGGAGVDVGAARRGDGMCAGWFGGGRKLGVKKRRSI